MKHLDVSLSVRERSVGKAENFAWSIGSGRKYMSDVELGKRNVSLSFASKVAHEFGITLYELFVLMVDEMKNT